MNKFLRSLAACTILVSASAAIAADNATLITPCASACVTMRAKDVGSGVQSMIQILGDTSGNPIYGTAGTANSNVLSVQGVASMTPLLATVTGSLTNIAGTISLPTGASTSALQTTGNTALTTINTTLGSPFQAGASIGNTTFAATQSGTWSVRNLGNAGAIFDAATGAAVPANAVQLGFSDGTNLIAGRVGAVANVAAATGMQQALAVAQYNATPLTVTDTRYQALQADVNGFLKVNVAAGGASGGTSSSFAAAFPATGTAVGMSQGGNMVALTGTSNNLNVQCANCSGSGVSTADEATFTAGTSLFAGTGGFFQTTATSNALTNGQQGMFQVTANRALFTNLRNAAGTEVGTSTTPLSFNLQQQAGTAITAVPSAYGTAPTGNVIGANVFVTNTNTNLVTNADGIAVVTAAGNAGAGSPVNSANYVFNGTTWDRMPGTTSGVKTNTAQVNGVTVLTGTGATGTGAQRVTVSTDQATNAGAALVKGGVGVVNGGSRYQAVAASQTATVLQSSTGATGDYLSHCVIYPASTSPGVVTVFDGSNTAANSAILFAGGATSTSNLTPIPVPVGSLSRNGSWQVTTGANVSVVCYGSFS